METKNVTFKILRYKPGLIDPPQFQKYELQVDENMTVLEGLKKIRLEQDSTLMFRHSCLHSSCGTCACAINGEQKLACLTGIMDLNASEIELRPLDGFRQIGDLVVDMHGFFKDISSGWGYLCAAEITASVSVPEGIHKFVRFENCIECGACVAACPVSGGEKRFVGPAVLTAVHRDVVKSPVKNRELIDIAAGKHGVGLCERALNCSRVCPTGVYPARHIADLRRLLGGES